MIGSLKGTVDSLGIDNCIIETAGGVGYRVFMPAAQLAQLTQGASVRLHIHTAVREDAIVLYGFLSREYYDLFELLLTISGVGPKMALGILSAVKPDAFYLAVQSRDIKVLTKLPGIGKKTAERLLLELKDKVGKGLAAGTGSPAMLPPRPPALRPRRPSPRSSAWAMRRRTLPPPWPASTRPSPCRRSSPSRCAVCRACNRRGVPN